MNFRYKQIRSSKDGLNQGKTKYGFMSLIQSLIFVGIILFTTDVISQTNYVPHWSVKDRYGIEWDLKNVQNLPHEDNIELSGQQVSGIVTYSVTAQKQLTISREIIFPAFHVAIPENAPSYAAYRAYLRDTLSDDIIPTIQNDNKPLAIGELERANINGILTFRHAPKDGVQITRKLLPSMTEALFMEQWLITNTSNRSVALKLSNTLIQKEIKGQKGTFEIVIQSDADEAVSIAPNETYSFAIYISAKSKETQKVDIIGDKDNDDVKLNPTLIPPLPTIPYDALDVIQGRERFLDTINNQLTLITPDPVLNTLFELSKVRAAESIFSTPMGLVHSPGGGRYYGGIWANDQAEYAAPFFPYLGYQTGNTASLNAYKKFYEQMQDIADYDNNIWSSYEMGGKLTCCGSDRGDAAMIAFGLSNFLMTLGDEGIANQYFPMLKWALGYCHAHLNLDGVVQSDTDEMEGRLPTGKANLATSSLYYGALQNTIHLCNALDAPDGLTNQYKLRAAKLQTSIELNFGAKINGRNTYQYFEGYPHLRHWICLPLVVDIKDRKTGTLDLLLDEMWTPNGIMTERKVGAANNEVVFWDRATLYGLMGAFKANDTERAYKRLLEFSTQRLTGQRVPYMIEAFPEGNMAHLSAESALYCRALIEGMFGLRPTGLNSFTLTPRLPKDWAQIQLANVFAFGSRFDIEVLRYEQGQVLVSVRDRKLQKIHKKIVSEGEQVQIKLTE